MVRKNLWVTRFIYNQDIGALVWRNGRRKGNEAGYRNKDGYLEINVKINGSMTKMLAHRIIFEMHYGYLPELIDHIDQDPTNNRISNLRPADKSLNALNTKPRINNKTGHKGVFLNNSGSYESSSYLSGKKYYHGSYKTIEEAVYAKESFARSNEIST